MAPAGRTSSLSSDAMDGGWADEDLIMAAQEVGESRRPPDTEDVIEGQDLVFEV